HLPPSFPTRRSSDLTLYSYFHDKDELYLALLARGSEGMVKALEDAVEIPGPARAKLIAFVQAVLIFFDAEPHLFDLIQVVEVLRDRKSTRLNSSHVS